jgi:hypothetical protein
LTRVLILIVARQDILLCSTDTLEAGEDEVFPGALSQAAFNAFKMTR